MKTKLAGEVELLGDISRVFAESLDLEMTLKSILKSLDTHLKLQRGTITLLESETETINIKVAHGLSEKSKKLGSYKVGEGITGLVVQTGREIVVPDISKDPRFLHKTRSRMETDGKRIAFFCVPIKLEGKTIGAMSVDRQAAKGDDFEDNVRLLNIIATMVAQAVKLNKLVQSERQKLSDENVRLRQELKTRFNIHNMIGSSNAIQQVYRLIEQVTDSMATVLIRGESGTGKDLVAHAIHYNSIRANKPFLKVNCTALPDTLLESELFGHEKGAFTDAAERKLGRFERAQGGMIALTKYLARKLAPQKIRVNSVSPGGLYTGQVEPFLSKYCNKVPVGRMANRDDIRGVVVFLASDASAYINGENILMDGGLHA
jgi:Nif-specific regulatory protein